MTLRILPCLSIAIVFFTSCGARSTSSDTTRSSGSTATSPDEQDRTGAHGVDEQLLQEPTPQPEVSMDDADVVTAMQLDGIWIFSTPPKQNAPDAGLSGVPFIIDDCLFVGGYVVLWWEDYLDQVPQVVKAAKAGTAKELIVGGAELEDLDAFRPSAAFASPLVPAVIAETCSLGENDAVWEASTGPDWL